MPATKAHLWHYAPFLRLLIPLTAGIVLQWYFPLPVSSLLITACFIAAAVCIYFLLPDKRKFQLDIFNGLLINSLLFIAGAFLVWKNDIRNEKAWIGQYTQNDYLVVRLLEPLVEKQNSYKA